MKRQPSPKIDTANQTSEVKRTRQNYHDTEKKSERATDPQQDCADRSQYIPPKEAVSEQDKIAVCSKVMDLVGIAARKRHIFFKIK